MEALIKYCRAICIAILKQTQGSRREGANWDVIQGAILNQGFSSVRRVWQRRGGNLFASPFPWLVRPGGEELGVLTVMSKE